MGGNFGLNIEKIIEEGTETSEVYDSICKTIISYNMHRKSNFCLSPDSTYIEHLIILSELYNKEYSEQRSKEFMTNFIKKSGEFIGSLKKYYDVALDVLGSGKKYIRARKDDIRVEKDREKKKYKKKILEIFLNEIEKIILNISNDNIGDIGYIVTKTKSKYQELHEELDKKSRKNGYFK